MTTIHHFHSSSTLLFLLPLPTTSHVQDNPAGNCWQCFLQRINPRWRRHRRDWATPERIVTWLLLDWPKVTWQFSFTAIRWPVHLAEPTDGDQVGVDSDLRQPSWDILWGYQPLNHAGPSKYWLQWKWRRIGHLPDWGTAPQRCHTGTRGWSSALLLWSPVL